MFRAMKERNLDTKYILLFVWLFLPMIITFDSAVNLSSSGAPIKEDPKTLVFEDLEIVGFEVSSRVQQEIHRPNYLNYSRAILPVENPEISSDFGWRVAPCKACSSDHQGVDFVPGEGEPVFAILQGIILEAGRNQGYGYWVKMEHIVPINANESERWVTIYAHLKKDSIPSEVRVGSVVQRGQILGAVGSTGISTGPHLHFELHIDGEVVDPLPILAQHQVVVDNKIGWR